MNFATSEENDDDETRREDQEKIAMIDDDDGLLVDHKKREERIWDLAGETEARETYSKLSSTQNASFRLFPLQEKNLNRYIHMMKSRIQTPVLLGVAAFMASLNTFTADAFQIQNSPTLLSVHKQADSKFSDQCNGQRRAASGLSMASTSTTATESTDTGSRFETKIVSEMPPPIPDNLKNKYYFLRHGQSTANVAGVISSARSLAYSDKHGLTSLGYEQGKESASQLLEFLKEEGAKSGDKLLFVTSPFARARQTAQACMDGLKEQADQVASVGVEVQEEVVFEDRLMERFFGRLDNEAIYTYAYVWPLDGFNVTHTAFDVESVAAVCTRLLEVVERFESEYDGYHIVWTSHADVLQIAQLYAANVENVGLFSSYRFKNGEVRPMRRTPDSLPEPSPLEAPDRGTSTA